MENKDAASSKGSFLSRSRIFWLVVLIFLVIDFVPYPGSPNFRYTGSDPERTVLNFGFPVASMIYDCEVEPAFILGPVPFFRFAAQLALLGLLAVVLLLLWPAPAEPRDKD